jgi:hypothetical protein
MSSESRVVPKSGGAAVAATCIYPPRMNMYIPTLGVSTMSMYAYIYTHMHMYMYMHMYIQSGSQFSQPLPFPSFSLCCECNGSKDSLILI